MKCNIMKNSLISRIQEALKPVAESWDDEIYDRMPAPYKADITRDDLIDAGWSKIDRSGIWVSPYDGECMSFEQAANAEIENMGDPAADPRMYPSEQGW